MFDQLNETRRGLRNEPHKADKGGNTCSCIHGLSDRRVQIATFQRISNFRTSCYCTIETPYVGRILMVALLFPWWLP